MATRRPERPSVAPEVLGAAVTVLLAVVARLGALDKLQFLPTLVDVTLAVAVTVIVAYIIERAVTFRSQIPAFAGTFVACAVVLLVIGYSALWVVTKPGRDARNAAASWNRVEVPERESRERFLSEDTGEYATGWGQAEEDLIRIHTVSKGSGMITWFATDDLGSRYYAEIEARRSSGPTDTACVLIFGWRDANWWYGLRLRFDGVQLARFEGSIPARSFAGPTELYYAEDLDDWHRLAVDRDGPRVRLFVDDREVFNLQIEGDLAGGVTFGTLDIGDGYNGDMECEFRDERILVRS